MKILKHTEDYRRYAGESVVTIGVFDGVHMGHQEIINRCVSEASRLGAPSLALTFERNPREVVRGECPCVITSPRRKLEILESFGLEFTVSVRFTKKFASMEPGVFCEQLLALHLGARKVCVGENFRFGAGGSGDVALLRNAGGRLGFSVDTVPLVQIDDLGQVSSTLIRGLICEGRASEVARGLGRPYAVTGKVVEGHSRGKRLGFPTANLALDGDFCIPSDGVYAGRAFFGEGRHPCAINIGSSPTFGDSDTALEVFLVDFEGDIYGEVLEVEFHHRLRDEKAFPGEEDLVRQMKKDVARTRELMKQPCGTGRVVLK